MANSGTGRILIGIVAIVASFFVPAAYGWAITALRGLGINMLLGEAIARLSSQNDGQQNREARQTYRGGQNYHFVVFGRTRVGGVLHFLDVAGVENADAYACIAHSIAHKGGIHRLAGAWFNEIYIPDIWIDTGDTNDVIDGQFAGYANIRSYLGTDDQTVDIPMNSVFGVGAKWPPTSVGHGISYTAYTCTRPSDMEDFREVFPKGFPSLTREVYGNLCYDPREDPAQGGSGLHDINDPDTWDWSDNPAICAANYLILPKSDGGWGWPTTIVDWDSVAGAANVCDETITVRDELDPETPVSAKRYTCSVALSTGDTLRSNMAKILDTMAGTLVGPESSGKVQIHAGVYETPVRTLDASWVRGSESSQSETEVIHLTEIQELYNTVSVTYTQPFQGYGPATASVARYESYIEEDGDEEIVKEFRIAGVDNEYRAQYLSHIWARKSRYQRSIRVPCTYRGLELAVWDTVEVTFGDALIDGIYRVIAVEEDDSHMPVLMLAEEHESIYIWDDTTDLTPHEILLMEDAVILPPPMPTGLTATHVREGVELTIDPLSPGLVSRIEAEHWSADNSGVEPVEVELLSEGSFVGSSTIDILEADIYGWQAYRVRSVGLDGTKSDWTDFVFMTIPSEAPPAPTLIAAAYGIEIESVVAGALEEFHQHTEYEIFDSGALSAFTGSFSGNKGFQPIPIDADDTYDVSVRYVFKQGYKSEWSATAQIEFTHTLSGVQVYVDIIEPPNPNHGDLWYDPTGTPPRLLSWNDDTATWEQVTTAAFIQNTAPADPNIGDTWYNTATTTIAGIPPATLAIWNGSTWTIVSNFRNTFIQTTEPVDAQPGDLWYNPETGNLQRYDGGVWERSSRTIHSMATDPRLTETVHVGDLWFNAAAVTVAGIQPQSVARAEYSSGQPQDVEWELVSTAVSTTVSTTAPAAPKIGDLWFNPDAGVFQRWDGSAWIPAAARTFHQDTRPVDPNVGDLWFNSSAFTVDSVPPQMLVRWVFAGGNYGWAVEASTVQTFIQIAAPSDPTIGDLWFSPNTGEFLRWDGDSWERAAVNTYRQSTQPSPRVSGDLWFNTATFVVAGVPPSTLARWNGGAWEVQATSNTTYVQSLAPADPIVGDLWFDIDEGDLFRWNGTEWERSAITTYVQDTVPADPAVGDMWYNTDEGTVAGVLPSTLARWNGSAWVMVGDVTLDHLSGAGTNLMRARYSAFMERDLPPIAFNAGSTLAHSSTGAIIGDKCLQITAGSAGVPAMWLTPALSDYNLHLEPNTQYLVSAWMSSNQFGASFSFRFRSSLGDHGSQSLTNLTTSMVRRAVVISTGNNGECQLRITMSGHSSVTWLRLDGIMIEKKLGNLTVPGGYALPAPDYGVDIPSAEYGQILDQRGFVMIGVGNRNSTQTGYTNPLSEQTDYNTSTDISEISIKAHTLQAGGFNISYPAATIFHTHAADVNGYIIRDDPFFTGAGSYSFVTSFADVVSQRGRYYVGAITLLATAGGGGEPPPGDGGGGSPPPFPVIEP